MPELKSPHSIPFFASCLRMIQKIADVGRRVHSMTKFSRQLLLSLLMSLLPAAGPLAAAADTAAQAARPKSPPDTHQSLSAKLLDFIGIPADSGALRGVDDPFEAGEVWVVEVAGGKSRQLTRTGEFRSPIFLPGGTDVLALRGSDVVRLSGPT